MASEFLEQAIQNYEAYIYRKGVQEDVVNAYIQAVATAFFDEKDFKYGLQIGTGAKKHLKNLVRKLTGGTIEQLEAYAQENNWQYEIINQYYSILQWEAPHSLHSFMLYMERYRPRSDRFYEPRSGTLRQVVDSYQKLEDDDLDELFVHLPPRVGKLMSDDTLVYTKDGWKKHGDLVVGDEVVGSDGGFTKVVAVHPKNVANMKVTLSDGSVFYCHHNHEWLVSDIEDCNKESVMETKALVGHTWRFFIPTHDFAWDAIISVGPCDQRPGNCITVAAKDGLYAVGEKLHLTHNSQTATNAMLWHIGRDTTRSNLYVTLNEAGGNSFIEGLRVLAQDPTYAYGEIFPNARIVDTDARNHTLDFETKKKYKSISGKGMDSKLSGLYDATGWLMIDDPLDISDVLNEAVLDRKKTLFTSNVMTRKVGKAKVVWNGTLYSLKDIFMTRHQWLEQSNEAEGIRHYSIIIPALDPNSDESNFSYKDLERGGFSTQDYKILRDNYEMNNDMAGWMALYQQEPIERAGRVFSEDQFDYFDELPEELPLKVIAHCDPAQGGGDFTAFPVIYVYKNGDMYLVDVVFDSSEPHVTRPQVVSMIKKYKIINVHFESNQGGIGYKEKVEEMLAEHGMKKLNISSDWAPVGTNKAQRIWDAASSIRQIKILNPQKREKQYRMFIQNLMSFSMFMSKRAHDDAPDSLAGAIAFHESGSGVNRSQIISSPI